MKHGEDATWRHGVMFDGTPLTDPKHRAAAEELLSEWGCARGLTPLRYVSQECDYRVGHGMEFSGEKTALSIRTRLQQRGARIPEPLQGTEERVPWPIPDGWQSPAAEWAE